MEERADQDLPQGTLQLEQILGDDQSDVIILQPTPTTDPNDPLNWSTGWKSLNFGLVCFYTLMVFVNVDVGTVIYGELYDDLGISYWSEQIAFGLNTLGLGIGCILFIPFALKFGRRPIYLFSILGSIGGAIWQGKVQNTGDLHGSNLLAGLAGSIAETICQMTVADIYFVHQRATANSVYLSMVTIGSFLGPVAAGYCAAAQGWRWIFWWTTIIGCITLVMFIFFYEETKYEPALQVELNSQQNPSIDLPPTNSPPTNRDRRKSDAGSVARLLSRQTSRSAIEGSGIPRRPYWKRITHTSSSSGDWRVFLRHTYQGFVIICTFPAFGYCAILFGTLLAWFGIVNNVYSTYFTLPPYNFGPDGIGLLNLPPFIGGVLGTIYGGVLSDWLIIRLARRNKGIFEPEMRLWLGIPCIILLPGALLMFGLSTADGLPWPVPCVALGIIGFCFVALGNATLTYAMDCYTEIIGDALIAICLVRNLVATVAVILLEPWTDAMGLKGVFIVSSVLCFLFCALTIPMMIWGKKVRIRTAKRFVKMSKRQYTSRT